MLFEGLHASVRIWNEGGIDPYMRGMLASTGRLAGEALERGFSDSIRTMLFELNQKIPVDIVALNIQRGRDHGLNTYWEYRR